MADTTQLHADQVDYWNGPGGERWVSNQSRTEAMLGEVAERALARAAVSPGESVIDIGCGCGGTSIQLAERVGPGGHVLALDVSAPILAVARERLAAYPMVETMLADAAAYDFAPESADLLFSRFGVMFFGDPEAAFANMRKALKPNGRLVFACWRHPKENPWMMTPLEATYRHVPPLPQPAPEDPGPFAFANPDRVSRILTGAGFEPPQFEPVDLKVDIAGGNGLPGAVACALELGPSARALEEQPASVRDAVASAMRDVLAPYEAMGTVRLGAAIWVVSTSMPGG